MLSITGTFIKSYIAVLLSLLLSRSVKWLQD